MTMKKILSFLTTILFAFSTTSSALAGGRSDLDIKSIPTEQVNPDTVEIDEVSTFEMLQMINNEDQKVAVCIEEHLEQIAAAVDAISEKFAAGGRIVYMGAGTSGRMGVYGLSRVPTYFRHIK